MADITMREFEGYTPDAGPRGKTGTIYRPPTPPTQPVTSTPYTPPPTMGTALGLGSQTPPSSQGTGSSQGSSPYSGTFPGGQVTLDNPMYPWLMPYQGDFTAPMSEYEQYGLEGMGDWVAGGQGLGSSQNYLEDVIGGRYLDPSTNRWLSGIQEGAGALQDIQDARAHQRIASSMAAGGNALSGARAAAESGYQNESDARYQDMISRLMSENYQRERGLQQGAIPLMGGLSNQRMGGFQSLMDAGALPRNLSQHDMTAQYGDWLRQIQGQEDAFKYSDQLAQQTLGRGYPGSSNPQFGDSAATGIMGMLLPLLQQLFPKKDPASPTKNSAGAPGGTTGTTQPGRPGQTPTDPNTGQPTPGYMGPEQFGPNPYWGSEYGDYYGNIDNGVGGSSWGDIFGDTGGWQDDQGGIHSGSNDDFLGSDFGFDPNTGWTSGNEFDNYGGYNDWAWPSGDWGGGGGWEDYGGATIDPSVFE